MRLACAERELPTGMRIGFGIAGLLGIDIPMAKALSHRPDLIGGTSSQVGQAIMRGPSAWSVAQRELFGAYCSALSHCPY